MNLSDKDYREFHDQIWERNKELIKENRKLKQELEETEHARRLCEENWKRCEQELEQNKNLYDLLKHDFEIASCDHLAEMRRNEELTRKNEKLSLELDEKKKALDFAINDFNDIEKENDKLQTRIDKLEKANNNLNKAANDILGENIEHKKQIEILETRKRNLELANERLVDEIKEVLKDNQGLDELYNKEKEKNHDLELANDCLRDEVIDLQNHVIDLQNRIDEVCDILMDDEYTPISERIEDLRWEHDPDRKISEILTAEKTEKGITITINSDNIL